MDLFQFEQAASKHSSTNPSSTVYNFEAISPTSQKSITMSNNYLQPSALHQNSGHVWNDPSQHMDGGLAKLGSYYPDQLYAQVTPPPDFDMQDEPLSLTKRADSGISTGSRPDPTMSSHSSTSPDSKSRPSVRMSQKTRKDSRVSDDDVVGDHKKEKYREKNRVAAAKCRAKKKEHTDHLEDDHRTQNALNTALKQTEKSLRDELSFWRTQALQHTFCDCHSIQNYNLQKAQSMTAGKQFGMSKPFSGHHRSSTTANFNNFKSQAVPGSESNSPVMNDISDPSSFSAMNAETYGDINQECQAYGDMRKASQASQLPAMPIMSDMEMNSLVGNIAE
jgi:hypothetical protein